MLSEVYLGKRGRLNPIASIRYISERENRSKNWQIIGLIGILAGILILSYYSVIAGWTMAYATRTAFGVINNIDALGEEARLLLEQSFAEMVNYNALVMSAVSGENVENVLRELKKFVIKGASGKSSEGQTDKDDSPWNL